MPRVDLDAFQVMPNHVHAIFKFGMLRHMSELWTHNHPSHPVTWRALSPANWAQLSAI
jgi:hypothetical protein